MLAARLRRGGGRVAAEVPRDQIDPIAGAEELRSHDICGLMWLSSRFVGETELVGSELIEPCARCGAPTAGVVTETIVGDRVAWAVSTRCPVCADAAEVDGWDDIPDVVRRALVARVGLVRLCADPDASRPLRVSLLAVFRKRGATISAASAAYAALVGAGIVGTPATMTLLANQLIEAGATATLTRHTTIS